MPSRIPRIYAFSRPTLVRHHLRSSPFLFSLSLAAQPPGRRFGLDLFLLVGRTNPKTTECAFLRIVGGASSCNPSERTRRGQRETCELRPTGCCLCASRPNNANSAVQRVLERVDPPPLPVLLAGRPSSSLSSLAPRPARYDGRLTSHRHSSRSHSRRKGPADADAVRVVSSSPRSSTARRSPPHTAC